VNWLLFIYAGWLIIGFVLFLVFDHHEMNQHVPYPDIPFGVPLRFIRVGLLIVIELFWPFIISGGIIKDVSRHRSE
jgi:hypothetical protein